MKKLFYILIFLFGVTAIVVLAQDLSSITYPVAELGNCQNQEECEAYCDNPDNMAPCLDFAEEHNLLPAEEIEMGRKMLQLGQTSGPGGCQGHEECEAYCDNFDHLEECLNFAKQHDMLPPDELAEVEKVLAAIKRGIRPPPCHGKTECDIYCAKPENMEECMIFAEAAGLIPPEEIEEVRKVLQAIKQGATPPPCAGKEECDIYCEEHILECVDFAVAAGFMTEEEALMVKKTGGKGPGGCKGEEECEAYCDNPDHMEECIKFALEYGFMTQEEADQALKMLEAGLTGGPGGCKGQEECDAFCENPDNMKECIEFSVKAGFMTQEEADQALEMVDMGLTSGPGGCQGEEECNAFCENPANLEECLDFAVKMGDITEQEKEEILRGGGMHGDPCKMPEGMSPEDIPIEDIPPECLPQDMPPGGYDMPPPPGEHQYQEQYEEEYKKQYEEEYERQMQQMAPPEPETVEPIPERLINNIPLQEGNITQLFFDLMGIILE